MITSCDKYIVTNVYQKTYSNIQEQNVYYDVYKQLSEYDIDSIPLENWLHNDLISDTISIEQKTISKIVNKNSRYIFIYTKYVYPIKCICPERIHYDFLIRYSGYKKDLQK
jgi:hypothetical protein